MSPTSIEPGDLVIITPNANGLCLWSDEIGTAILIDGIPKNVPMLVLFVEDRKTQTRNHGYAYVLIKGILGYVIIDGIVKAS